MVWNETVDRWELYDVAAIGNAIVDVIAMVDDAFLQSFANEVETGFFYNSTATAALTLTIFDGTSASDAKIVANCVFNSFAFNSDKNGDATLTANFENADGVAPVVTWLI